MSNVDESTCNRKEELKLFSILTVFDLKSNGAFLLFSLQCFFYEDSNDKRWKPTPFSCLVAETLIALFVSGNVTPAEAETKMQDWGGKPVRVS